MWVKLLIPVCNLEWDNVLFMYLRGLDQIIWSLLMCWHWQLADNPYSWCQVLKQHLSCTLQHFVGGNSKLWDERLTLSYLSSRVSCFVLCGEADHGRVRLRRSTSYSDPWKIPINNSTQPTTRGSAVVLLVLQLWQRVHWAGAPTRTRSTQLWSTDICIRKCVYVLEV